MQQRLKKLDDDGLHNGLKKIFLEHITADASFKPKQHFLQTAHKKMTDNAIDDLSVLASDIFEKLDLKSRVKHDYRLAVDIQNYMTTGKVQRNALTDDIMQPLQTFRQTYQNLSSFLKQESKLKNFTRVYNQLIDQLIDAEIKAFAANQVKIMEKNQLTIQEILDTIFPIQVSEELPVNRELSPRNSYSLPGFFVQTIAAVVDSKDYSSTPSRRDMTLLGNMDRLRPLETLREKLNMYLHSELTFFIGIQIEKEVRELIASVVSELFPNKTDHVRNECELSNKSHSVARQLVKTLKAENHTALVDLETMHRKVSVKQIQQIINKYVALARCLGHETMTYKSMVQSSVYDGSVTSSRKRLVDGFG